MQNAEVVVWINIDKNSKAIEFSMSLSTHMCSIVLRPQL